MSTILAARQAATGVAPAPAANPPGTLWLVLALVAALVAAAMPGIHRHTFGAPAIETATIHYAQEAYGRSLTDGERTIVRDYVASQSPAMDGAVSFVTVLLAVAVGGGLLAAASVLVGAELSAASTLRAAAAGQAVVVLLRAVLWSIGVAVRGPDGAAAIDWLHVAPVSLGVLLEAVPGGLVGNMLYAVDLSLAAGAVTVAMLLTTYDRRLGTARALLAATVFPLVIIGWRLLIATLLDVPLL